MTDPSPKPIAECPVCGRTIHGNEHNCIKEDVKAAYASTFPVKPLADRIREARTKLLMGEDATWVMDEMALIASEIEEKADSLRKAYDPGDFEYRVADSLARRRDG